MCVKVKVTESFADGGIRIDGLPSKNIQTNFFRQMLRLSLYERISTENRRFRYNGVSLTQNFR